MEFVPPVWTKRRFAFPHPTRRRCFPPGGRQAAAAECIAAAAAGVIADVQGAGDGVGPARLGETAGAGVTDILVGGAEPTGHLERAAVNDQLPPRAFMPESVRLPVPIIVNPPGPPRLPERLMLPPVVSTVPARRCRSCSCSRRGPGGDSTQRAAAEVKRHTAGPGPTQPRGANRR